MGNQYVIPLSWRNLALVIAGGVALWGVPWMVWPSASRLAGKPERRPLPVFRYIRAAQGLDGSAWSPVLMPLPTPDGFSKKAALKELPNKSLVSVLKPKISGPVYLLLEPGNVDPAPVPNISFIRPGEFDPESSLKLAPKMNAVYTPNVIRFEIPEPLRYRKYEIPALPAALSNVVDQSLIQAMATVELDGQGRVQHVLLEQPSGIPVVDSAIVRVLRAGRGIADGTMTRGRVKFFYWKNSSVQKE